MAASEKEHDAAAFAGLCELPRLQRLYFSLGVTQGTARRGLHQRPMKKPMSP